MTLREALANTIFAISMATVGRSAYRHLVKAAAEPREAQQRALTTILRALQTTEYGQQHGYDRLRTADERCAPISIVKSKRGCLSSRRSCR